MKGMCRTQVGDFSESIVMRSLRHIHALLLFGAIAVLPRQAWSQCNPPYALDCQSSNVLCSLSELDGYQCENIRDPNPTGPDPLCYGDGVPHNTAWWAFVGNGDNIQMTFIFDSTQCDHYNTNQLIGIQAGILDACGGQPVDCNAACNADTFTLSGYVNQCQTYYVWVDGCNGDVCQYEIAVDQGKPPEIPTPLPDMYVVGNLCMCNEVAFCVGALGGGTCQTEIRWKLDNVPQPQWDNQMCMQNVQLTDTFPVEVCVSWILGNPNNPNAICDQKDTCYIFHPAPPDTFEYPLEELCYETHKYDYTWTVKNQSIKITSSCEDPPCKIQLKNTTTGCCEVHLKPFILLPQRPVGLKYVFKCDKTPYIDENGVPYNQTTCNKDITFKSPFGTTLVNCDTTYTLNLDYYDPKVNLEISCPNCAGYYLLRADYLWISNCMQGTLTELPFWINPNGDTLWGSEIQVDPGEDPTGQYLFYIYVEYTHPSDSNLNQICDFYTGRFLQVDPVKIEPPRITGDSLLCRGEKGSYTYLNPHPNACKVAWEIRKGNGIILTRDKDTAKTIEVQWNYGGSDTGLVCVSSITDCGKGNDSCFTVLFKAAPEPDAGPDTAVCGLQYTMQATPDAPGGQWEIVTSPGQVQINTSDPNSNVSVDAYGSYTFVWKEKVATCDGLDSVTIQFRPDPIIARIDTLCNENADSFRVRLQLAQGATPYTIVEGQGSFSADTFLSDPLTENQTHVFRFRDAYGCEVSFQIKHDCQCPSALGQITKDTIKLCGNEEATIQYDPSGQVIGPNDVLEYYLFDDPNDMFGSYLSRNTTGKFAFDPNTMQYGKVYYLGVAIGKDDGQGHIVPTAGCIQQDFHPVIWYEMPQPQFGPDTSICGLQITVPYHKSVAQSSITWFGLAGTQINPISSSMVELSVTQPGRYNFIIRETVEGLCQAEDTIVVDFYPIPEFVNLKKICLDRDTLYRWYYEICIDNGTPNYTILKGTGNFDGTTQCFTSSYLYSKVSDTLLVVDANGCSAQIVVSHNCDCGLTAIGSTVAVRTEVCEDQCVVVKGNNDHQAEPDDCVKMILHSHKDFVDPSDPVLVIQNFDPNGNTFCFDTNTMTPGQTYYVSYVIAECNNGQINLNDFCLRLNSVPVVFHAYPKADAGEDKLICGLSTQLEAVPGLGMGSWSVLSKPQNANILIDIPTSPNTTVTVDQFGSYILVWQLDNNGCVRSDTLTLTFQDAPNYRNVKIICDDVAENYKVQFEVYGGDQQSLTVQDPQWTITPLGGGLYETEWVPNGTNVSIEIFDQYKCQIVRIDTSYQCPCITAAGILSLTDSILCEGESITVAYTGGTLDANDALLYVLHDGTATQLGTILQVNATGIFAFDPNIMQYNKTYYIVAVSGNTKPDGSIDIDDRCLAVSNPVPITWYQLPQVRVNPNSGVITCKEESIVLDASVSTDPSGKGTLQYQWSTQDGAFAPGTDPNAATVRVTAPGTYRVVVTNDYTNCTAESTVQITEDRVFPTAQANVEKCQGQGIQLSANGSSSGSEYVYEWKGPGISPQQANSPTPITTQSGWHYLTVRNTQTGCVSTDSVYVDLLQAFETQVIDITCPGTNDGKIQVQNVSGGTAPYEISFNGGPFEPLPQSGWQIDQLAPGQYTITVRDALGCTVDHSVELTDATPIAIETRGTIHLRWGDDLLLDSTITRIVVERPDQATIQWFDENGNPINPQLQNIEYPLKLKVVLTDHRGCTTEAELIVLVRVEYNVYIPSVINTQLNSLPENNKLYVYAHPKIADKITAYRIYDRWGELIYEYKGEMGFDNSGRSEDGWDGTFKNRFVSPGVYVYYIEVQFKDFGSGAIKKAIAGDVTVIR